MLAYCLFLVTCCRGQDLLIKRLDGTTISKISIDSTVLRLMNAADVAGLSLAIMNNNRPVYVQSYGFRNKPAKEILDTNTVLQGASFTKAVFAYLSMVLVEEKLIDLDTPLYRYLKRPIPEYPYYAPLKTNDLWKLITARMCLSHISGLPNSRWINVRTGDRDTIDKMAIYFTPGKRYAYSGEGLRLLQFVVEEVTGKTIEDLATEKIFGPAGMSSTGFIWHAKFDSNYAIGHLANGSLNPKKKRTEANAAGSMVTTITDFSRFISYLMSGKGLSTRHRNMMLTPQIRINSRFQFPTITDDTTAENMRISLSYGLGLGLLKCKYGRAFFKEGHDDAWRNYMINFYDQGVGIILMTNSANGELIFKELLEKLIADTYTPWKWENYIPYNHIKSK